MCFCSFAEVKGFFPGVPGVAQGQTFRQPRSERAMAHKEASTCEQQPDPTRRSFLQAGLASGLGLLLGEGLQARGDAAKNPPAKALIQVCLTGGLSHLDSFDPKPAAGSEYQCGLGTVQTRLDGVLFGELLPQTAQVADRLTVCRSLTHDEEGHGGAQHYLFTGHPPEEKRTFPSMGSVVAHQLGVRKSLPPYVCIPGTASIHAGPGPLGEAFAPFSLGREPAAKDYKPEQVVLPWPEDDKSSTPDPARISTRAARAAFDLNAEPASLRDDYGRHGIGQKLLLARRMVAAGVRFVSVACGNWNMSIGIKRYLQEKMPPFDQGFSALIRDLERTGMLDSTLVLVCTEFGRTPKINARQGRDPWPQVFSTMLAGGGVKKGFVYGSSDASGAEPKDDPLSPEDLAATVYHLLGIDPGAKINGADKRAFEIVKGGKVRKELLA
jgi:hypothetical protein